MTFLGLLDAAIEVADEGKQPAIGECFEEMAEVKCILDIHHYVRIIFYFNAPE